MQDNFIIDEEGANNNMLSEPSGLSVPLDAKQQWLANNNWNLEIYYKDTITEKLTFGDNRIFLGMPIELPILVYSENSSKSGLYVLREPQGFSFRRKVTTPITSKTYSGAIHALESHYRWARGRQRMFVTTTEDGNLDATLEQFIECLKDLKTKNEVNCNTTNNVKNEFKIKQLPSPSQNSDSIKGFTIQQIDRLIENIENQIRKKATEVIYKNNKDAFDVNNITINDVIKYLKNKTRIQGLKYMGKDNNGKNTDIQTKTPIEGLFWFVKRPAYVQKDNVTGGKKTKKHKNRRTKKYRKRLTTTIKRKNNTRK